MRKKTVWNLVMVAAIVAILVSGVMIAGSVRGKFDTAKPVEAAGSVAVAAPAAQAQNKRGSVNIERGGIAYALAEKDTLKDGDIIETLHGAGISLLFGKSEVCMSENSEVALHFDESAANITVTHGEVFVTADAENPLALTVLDANMTATDTVFSVSAPIGSANIAVFENTL
ncbi:MAG: FecR domain-containing protein, partial [Ruthenibacterium sp.]